MPNPLHPAVVHFPVVLAVLLPALTVAGVLLARRPERRTSWIAVSVFAMLLPLSAWAALETGEEQEDVVEAVVGDAPIHRHEEAAEGFLGGSVLLAAIVLAGLLPGRAGGAARAASVPVALVVLGLGYRVGSSGGDLVYTHGAAAAYVEGSTVGAVTPAAGRRTDDDDHEGDRRVR